MAFDAAMAKRVLGLVTRTGTSYTLSRTARTPNSSTPWKVSTATDSSITVRGILDDFRAAEVDGTVVKAGDRRYMLAASGMTLVPQPGDALTEDGDIFRVVQVQAVRPAGTDLLYILQVRK
jgi:hypothetical protein